VAPGTITYVEALGSQFSADEVNHDGDSWPLSLNDVQVLVGDSPAPDQLGCIRASSAS